MLGMITSFAECVAGEIKKCAFSPPFYPDDLLQLKDEAERITKEMGVSLWLEENRDIQEQNRVLWWVIYKFPEVLAEYRSLRAKGFNPAFEFDQFSKLLSYGYAFGENADQVVPGIREEVDTMATVKRIIFEPGDWPLDKRFRTKA